MGASTIASDIKLTNRHVISQLERRGQSRTGSNTCSMIMGLNCQETTLGKSFWNHCAVSRPWRLLSSTITSKSRPWHSPITSHGNRSSPSILAK